MVVEKETETSCNSPVFRRKRNLIIGAASRAVLNDLCPESLKELPFGLVDWI